MSDPIARLQFLNKKRLDIHTTRQRAAMAKMIAPALVTRIQAKLDGKFQSLTTEHNQLLELIKADPVLRKRLHEDEKHRVEKAGRAKDHERQR